MRNDNKRAKSNGQRRSRRTYTDLYINMGGGSLVSKDLPLTEEQADRAVNSLLDRAQKAVAARRNASGYQPKSA
ncbi:hypothetical protein [Sinomonas susongensis]|uniref:hypothetical protein n=1 Tax=Sinomonas susongensis TaxID=1324851 RepID=UPI0011089F85|nr:hypothetical protein [Sinomonas susongensis]